MKTTPSRRRPLTCLLGSSLAALLTCHPASGATVLKLDNSLDLTLPASWSAYPTPSDIALWDATVSGPNTTSLGADLALAGLSLTSPGGSVTLSAGNTLSLGSAGFDLSASTQNLTVAAGLKPTAPQSWKVPAGRTLDLAGPLTTTGAAFVDFSNFTGTLGTLTNDLTGILGPWATTGTQKTLNYVSLTSGIPGPATQTTATAGTLANVASETSNYLFTASATLAGDLTANTLRYTGTAAGLLTNGTKTLTLNGLMQSSDKALTIGTVTSGKIFIGNSRELKITTAAKLVNTAAIPAPILSILPPIADNPGGPSTLVFSGNNPSDAANTADTLLLGANDTSKSSSQPPNSTFTGGVIIASGIIRCGSLANGCLGPSPVNVTLMPKTILRPDRATYKGYLTLNGGTVWASNGFGDKWQPSSSGEGSITLAADSFFYTSSSGNFNISVPLTGAGGFTKMGTANGTVVLSAPTSYSGPTVIWGGILHVTKPTSLYGGDESKWTPANITFSPSARTPLGTFLTSTPLPTLRLNTGGPDEFTTGQIGTLLTNLTTISNNGMMAGATIGIDTTNAIDPISIGTNIRDATGPGSGPVNIKTFGTGTVQLAGANTYSGKTIIDGTNTSGTTTLSVESLNSLVTNPALGTVHTPSSNLGAPTTAANGLIEFGNDGSNFIATLLYTGPGETTDRTISLPGQGGTNTIDQSGSGLLKFISPILIGQPTINKSLTLAGSSDGELAAPLGNPGSGTVTHLNKQGGGTWTLSAVNTFSGNLNIQAGTLAIAGAGSLKNGSYEGNISNSSELRFETSADQTLSGTISGSGTIIKTGTGTLTMTGSNIYTGSTRVGSGLLALNSNSIRDTNTLVITSGKVAPTGVVTVHTLAVGLAESEVPAGSTWGATGSGAANIDDEHFTGTAGIIKVVGEYDLWSAASGLTSSNNSPNADPDNDSVPNLLEFIFGSEPNPANADASSTALLPEAIRAGDNLIFSFLRKDLSEPGTILTFQWSTDASFPNPNTLSIGPAGTTLNGITTLVQEDTPDSDTDTITISIPATKAEGGKLFGRLRAVLP